MSRRIVQTRIYKSIYMYIDPRIHILAVMLFREDLLCEIQDPLLRAGGSSIYILYVASLQRVFTPRILYLVRCMCVCALYSRASAGERERSEFRRYIVAQFGDRIFLRARRGKNARRDFAGLRQKFRGDARL